jgi:hypothetical protein
MWIAFVSAWGSDHAHGFSWFYSVLKAIPGQCLKFIHMNFLPHLSNSLFTDHPVILPYIHYPESLITEFHKPQIIAVNTVSSESRCALRRRYVDCFRPVSMLVDITSNTFYKCTATFRTQIWRKCLRIKLNGLRPVYTLVDITSNTFYKCTATFRTHCT